MNHPADMILAAPVIGIMILVAVYCAAIVATICLVGGAVAGATYIGWLIAGVPGAVIAAVWFVFAIGRWADSSRSSGDVSMVYSWWMHHR